MDPSDVPLRQLVGRAAAALSRALDEALTAAGGSSAIWHVLQAMAAAERTTQAELARAIGIRPPTLTHHLDAMERSGFVTRHRDPGDRRAQRVTMTADGERLFRRLRRAAASFDGRLGAGFAAGDVADLRRLLDLVVENALPDRAPDG